MADMKYLYTKYLGGDMTMNYNEIATELHGHIQQGRLNDVQSLLESISNQNDVTAIDNEFMALGEHRDIINYAIDNRKEKIALYLVEKAFPLDHIYWEDKAVCDEWCYKNHGPDKCPQQYDCCKNAERQGMEKLKLRLDLIKQGRYKPGEGLSESNVEKFLPHKPPARQQKPSYDTGDQQRYVPEKKEKSHCEEAREYFEQHRNKYSKNRGTLLHECVDKPRYYIYVLANHGVPVNIQDNNGDTALHLAVRKGRADIVEALIQCGADLTLRNKLAQSPVDEAEGGIQSFLKTFEPGIINAINYCHLNQVCRIHKRDWINVHTKIKQGDKSLLDWTHMLAEGEMKSSNKTDAKKEMDLGKNAFRILSSYQPTSELIHAVLCEDVELARQVLNDNKGISVNVRFRDYRIGKTLLSYAIEANNYELVQLLIDARANVAQVRVRENEQTKVTVPLYQKALRRDLDINIVKLLQRVLMDSSEHEEKDCNGNTPLLRAIEMGVDTKTIHWLITVRGGYSLMDRNIEGLTARELAQKKSRDNVVKMIDRYITQELHPMVLRLFPVAFYPPDLLNIVDEDKNDSEVGDTLEQKLTKVAEQHHVSKWIDPNQTQNQAIRLFSAAAKDDLSTIHELNDACYQDKNGYTALTRAIVFNRFKAAEKLIIHRPALRKIGDNYNRYPLHYAYALPWQQGEKFITLIIGNDGSEIDSRVDKDGVVAADYAKRRHTQEIRQMLYDARTCDAFGKHGPPLGAWPPGAETFPPMPDEESGKDFSQSC
ncbi:hypothetical protein ACF0H5_015177 [Mactra antiquata]